MTEERKPTDITNEALWDFPMDYPLKVLGEAQHPLAQIVAEILLRHVPDFDPASIAMRPSSGGKYISITASVYVTHKGQINGMYADFAAHAAIKMVL
jgi:putative lipoic acid-binding regulatory protein